jgi:ribulose-phosphate 3-epimerase
MRWRLVEAAGADQIHVDVMDGHFVPNITIGPPVVAALKRVTRLPLDVHLMIADPDRYLEAFASAGASIITVHSEAATHLHRTLTRIRQLGAKAGVAINPATPIDHVQEVACEFDVLLSCLSTRGSAVRLSFPEAWPKSPPPRRCWQPPDAPRTSRWMAAWI